MKRNRIVILVIFLLAVAVAVAAVVRLGTHTPAAQGTVRVDTGSGVVEVELGELTCQRVRGQMKTGKGEVREIDAQGFPLRALLTAAGVDPETWPGAEVAAGDGYYATVRREELMEEGKVFLIAQEEGGVRLIVFGDENSKRNVSDVEEVRSASAGA